MKVLSIFLLLGHKHLRPTVALAVSSFCLIFMATSITSSCGRDAVAQATQLEASQTKESTGPTIDLSYSSETFKDNPVSSFLYFIPLISPSLVERKISPLNSQQIGVVSYERKLTATSFCVTCRFDMRGTGSLEHRFDRAAMIAAQTEKRERGETLKHMLDYIKFDGNGVGVIEIKGTIADSVETVTQIDLQFNAKGKTSPVTIGMYDVEPKDRYYGYENRSNEMVARVNTLSFRRGGNPPRMDVTLASVSCKGASEGFISGIKGALANLLIKPVRVDRLGNETMLKFGYAMFKQQPQFTFPLASHLKGGRAIAAN